VKVVQMLYSYLLTQSEFHIDSAPEAPSADRRFAYAVYLDILLGIMELSGITTARARNVQPLVVDKLLRDNRVGTALASVDELKTALTRGNTDIDAIRPHLQRVADAIAQSELFRDYKKNKMRTPADEARFWSVAVESILLKEPELAALMRTLPGYTGKGLEMGLHAVQASLAAFGDARLGYLNAKSDLIRSLDKAYDLYFGIFELIVEITREQRNRIEAAKEKYIPTAADLNPETRFIDNAFVKRLLADEAFSRRLEKCPSQWSDDPVLVPRLLDAVLASEVYASYMAAPSVDYEKDCELWRDLCKNVIFPSDVLTETMENRSLYWNDDLQTMGTFVLKSIRQMASAPSGAPMPFLPKYKDTEDENFGPELFSLAVEHKDEYRSYIDRFINAEHWDPERLAFMDTVIMTCAIAELVNYPAIPVPVTMNEYVEIANNYSTARSGQFVNGLLYAVSEYLRSEGILTK